MADPKTKRAAVVGSGFGGLAVAIRLQAAGFQTTLFEARDLPGGRAYVYRDKGFIFDAGPTVITVPECIEEVFQAAGRRMQDYVELLPVTPFYRLLWEDGSRFDYLNDQSKLEEQIRARNPRDVEGYRRFYEYSRKVCQTGYTELAAVPFLRFSDMIKVAPQLIGMRADRSVYATVSRFIEDPRLREAFSFHSLLVGGNPFSTSAIYTLIHYLERTWGVHFPRGGTGSLVQAFAKLFGELGGELRLSSPVERIELKTSGAATTHLVTTGAKSQEPFDLVVSNADLQHTYGKLLAGEKAAAPMRKKLARADWSNSLFVVYFGTDKTYPGTAHHTILFAGKYKELLQGIFDGPDVPDEFSLYLHYPTATDPGMGPPGCGTFYVLSPVPHLGKAQIDWREFGPRYADKILASLEQHLPDLRKHIVTQRILTPQDFESEQRSYRGSTFSIAPTLTQSAWFRPHNRDPRIPGLYIVGAGTHPGAGLPGVINSAKATAGLIAQDFAG